MNVSSVKNLNGETFSAVQDTFLTDIVSSNSANWNEISAYQANSGNYQLTADMTGYLTTGDSANFLTAVPDTYLQNIDLTISEGKITEISGVPLSAGDEFPQSATEAIETVTSSSAMWNETTDTVSSNSGVWGGSALPISAGPGIKFEMVNDTLVASVDETVLWENSAGASAFSLSEAATGFDNLQITYYPSEGGTAYSTVMYVPSTATSINLFSKYIKVSNDFIIEDVTKFTTNDFTNYSYGAGVHAWYSTIMERQGGAGGDCFNRVTKVIGINRISANV